MAVANIALIELVREHVLEDKRLAGLPVDVTCSGGYIQLVGWVETVAQKRLAVLLAYGIPGVRHVDDHIRIRRTARIQVV